jgi:hypothetical protein
VDPVAEFLSGEIGVVTVGGEYFEEAASGLLLAGLVEGFEVGRLFLAGSWPGQCRLPWHCGRSSGAELR